MKAQKCKHCGFEIDRIFWSRTISSSNNGSHNGFWCSRQWRVLPNDKDSAFKHEICTKEYNIKRILDKVKM